MNRNKFIIFGCIGIVFILIMFVQGFLYTFTDFGEPNGIGVFVERQADWEIQTINVIDNYDCDYLEYINGHMYCAKADTKYINISIIN